MAGPTEFSLESVRQYMLGRDGQVTNHELVKYFRAWLTSPTEKESARQRFKEYVNTLATIRQENGEKYLVLKRKYYPQFDDEPPSIPAINNLRALDNNSGLNISSTSNSSSLLDEVMASYTPMSKQQSKRQLPPTPPSNMPIYGHLPSHETQSTNSYHNSPSGSQRSSYASSVPHMQNVPPHMQHRSNGPSMPNSSHMFSGDNLSHNQPVKQQPPVLPPYRPPPTQHYRAPPPQPPLQDHGLPMPSDYGLPTPRQGVFHPPSNAYAPPNMNSSKNPFEAVGLPSITAYNSVGQTVHPNMPPLPARHRESIDSGNSHFSRSSSSMSIQGSAAYQSSNIHQQQTYQRQQPHPSSRSHTQQGPVHPMYPQQGHIREPIVGMVASNNMQYSNTQQKVVQPQYQQQQHFSPPPLPSRNLGSASGSLSKHHSHHSSQSSIATRSSHGEPVSRKGSSEPESSKIMKGPYNQVEMGMDAAYENHDIDYNADENLKPSLHHTTANQSSSMHENSVDIQSAQSIEQQRELQEQISVKERTKTFNRMASQVELDSGRGTCSGENLGAAVNGMVASTADSGSTSSVGTGNSSSAFSANSSVKRRNSRAAGPMTSIPGDRQSRASSSIRGDENETSSISTLDQTAKQWMVKASQGDYHALAKMLKEDPRLAKHKDFVSGYTALHWAAKHGNLDMIKLLAGSYSVQVNQKSHGGYTSLHLACQFGHQEVFDILVKAYGADPHLRDNSGRKPRQYMVVQDQAMGLSLSNDTFRQLKDRRRHRRQAGKAPTNNRSSTGALSRFGSLSVKVKRTTEAFNNYFNSAKNGDVFAESGGFAPSSLPPIIDSSIEESGEFQSSMENTPRETRKTSEKIMSNENDCSKMPPPKFPSSAHSSIKKRRSKRSVDYGSGSNGGSMTSLGAARSAPVTPTSDRSSSKDESIDTVSKRTERASYGSHMGGSEDSDSEYGFDGPQWSEGPRT